jgi:hypothetical protein
MKPIRHLLLVAALLLITNLTYAQEFNVSGTVTNDKGEPLKSATVFIGGSDRRTPTDDNGKFNLANVPQGTFQLSVQIIGYAPLTRNIIVKNAPVKVDLKLQPKAISLNQVVIGKKGAREQNFQIFKENFLGRSANAKQCVILNPEIINFSTKRGLLLADADDFLIIENRRLGYRIHYLLQDFGYNSADDIALYHGEFSFEEMEGTDEKQTLWAKARLQTYQGSFMHFLRSVYANNTLENGFITKAMYGYRRFNVDNKVLDMDRAVVQNTPVKFDSLLTAIDTSFASFKFNQLHVIYDPKKAATVKENKPDVTTSVYLDSKTSILKLSTEQAIIDKKGSYTDYRSFFIHGRWAMARVGDQLPVAYKPPVPDIPRRIIPANSLLTSLQKWTDSIPQEKIYLHMDKPYYATGDTIWFKGYLTTGSSHQLSLLSGAIYVDLINDQNQPLKTLKLPLNSGTVAGSLILSDDIKDGGYRIRAYTQWMRNAGDEYFFDKTITVGKPLAVKKENIIKPNLQQTDIQFFPESGHLVNGTASRIAFKATGVDGLGVNIAGNITDNEHNPVASINTLHAGMGSFLLRPLPGKTYTANIKFADSTTKSIPLPTAATEGYALAVYQPNKDSVLVRIQASALLLPSTVNLVIHNSGDIIYASPVTISGAMTSIWLDKQSFPGGIAQFTIFNNNNEPLNERIAFIKNDSHMQLALKTEKETYKSKEHVQIQLNAKGGDGETVAANFSVSVINEDKVPVDEDAESTIFSNILLSSDIKGYIEKPNYYFSADTGEVNKALDNLMLTQGYRRFEWKSLNNIVSAQPMFAAEGRGATISGTVTDLQHQKIENARILLVSTNARITKDTVTDANGRFRFDNLVFADSARFAVQAKNVDNTNNAIIILDTIPTLSISKKQMVADVSIIDANLQKAEQEGKPAQLAGAQVLKQVNIKAAKKENENKDAIGQGMFSIPEASADKVIRIPDPENYTTLDMFLQARLPGISLQTSEEGYRELIDMRASTNLINNDSDNGSRSITVVLNGRATASAETNDILTGSIQPDEVDRILLVRTNEAKKSFLRMGNLKQPAGYVLIITKPVGSRKQYNHHIANILPKGFNKVRQFYSPRYDRPDDSTTKLADMRTTIYWNPYVNTDDKGEAKLDFFNADGPGTYRVVIEGINAAGELGRQVYHYKLD